MKENASDPSTAELNNMSPPWIISLILATFPVHALQKTRSRCHIISETFKTVSELKILEVTGAEIHNHTVSPLSPYLPADAPRVINFCNLTVATSHGTDIVWQYIWLPLEDWNGRFVAAGGGGYAAGDISQLPPLVAQGYAAGTSDGGLTLNNTISASSALWVLDQPGQWNLDLMLNFAYRTIHDLSLIGKAVVQDFYEKPADFSYYMGCSTGGRQGYSSAHFYPDDFDGIVASAPAIYTARYSVGALWPTVVLTNVDAPPNCVFEHYRNSIIQACDELDGLVDGIITNPEDCRYDTSSEVGTSIACADTTTNVTITADHAIVVSKILEGARLQNGDFAWYGLPAGASFSSLARTLTVNGTTEAASAAVAGSYVSYFVFQDPLYDVYDMTFADFDEAYALSVEKLTSLFPFDSPDLHAFQSGGKKMITWHGQADSYIPPGGTLRFRRGLEVIHGGREATNDFHRVFLAPGADHCVSSTGPAPVSNVLSVLAEWVERGTAPDTIHASTVAQNGTTVSRNLCLWPKLPYYSGQGDPTQASSFRCE